MERAASRYRLRAAPARPETELGARGAGEEVELMLYRSDEASFFNDLLRSDDIVAAYPGHAHLLRSVRGPETLVVTPSLTRPREALAKIEDTPIDYINRNPEGYATHDTPEHELADLPGTIAAFRAVCRERGAKLGLTPDRRILAESGRPLAPLVDLLGVQVQRDQHRPDAEFRATLASLVEGLRAASPGTAIFIQVSTGWPFSTRATRPTRPEGSSRCCAARS